MTTLAVQTAGLTKTFGAITAVSDLDLEVLALFTALIAAALLCGWGASSPALTPEPGPSARCGRTFKSCW